MHCCLLEKDIHGEYYEKIFDIIKDLERPKRFREQKKGAPHSSREQIISDLTSARKKLLLPSIDVVDDALRRTQRERALDTFNGCITRACTEGLDVAELLEEVDKRIQRSWQRKAQKSDMMETAALNESVWPENLPPSH